MNTSNNKEKENIKIVLKEFAELLQAADVPKYRYGKDKLDLIDWVETTLGPTEPLS